jgi:hypothetical protein
MEKIRPALHLITAAPLPYLLSVPDGIVPANGAWPVLCFLHGYDEGAPMPIRQALTRHGPLRPTSAQMATSEFLVVAPQLPGRGDLWPGYAHSVQQIVLEIQNQHHGDPCRTYLTGFSFGANGVLDLPLRQPRFWAALWPVDPTRLPEKDPDLPIWLSLGEISRHRRDEYTRRLGLEPLPGGTGGDRVCTDQQQDHVKTSILAYQDHRIYDWLLSKQRRKTT